METIAILSDQQARYNDKITERAVNKFLADLKPNVLVNNGDLFDFEALGSYRKTLAQKESLLKDWRAGRAVLERQRKLLPKTRIVLIEGNHEERWTRYMIDNAEAMSMLPSMGIPNSLCVNDYDVEFVGPYGKGIKFGTLHIYHGSFVSMHSGYSAKRELEKSWTSGVSGHTHRLGATYFTDRLGQTHAWYENGCLCYTDSRIPAGGNSGSHNWQQGFSWGYRDGNVWNIYQTAITRHKFIANGKLYTP